MKNNKLKKVMAALLCGSMMLGVLTGCGNSGSTQTPSTETQQESGKPSESAATSSKPSESAAANDPSFTYSDCSPL